MTQLQEVSVDQYKHLVSERALTGETTLLNMGPQHPSTHGVLRLLLELDGETVINCIPDIGYLHTGVEKNMEAKTYQKAEVMTDRLDYMNTMGIPIPLAPAWAEYKGRVVIALFPQMVRITLDRLIDGGDSLLDNDDFQRMRQLMPKDAYAISYVDSAVGGSYDAVSL